MSEDKDLLEKEKQGREASDENMKEDEYEKVCFLCRRPESKTGPMITLPQNIHICTECMQKSFDTMNNSNMNYGDLMSHMPNISMMDLSSIPNQVSEKQRVKKKKKTEEKKQEFTMKDVPPPHKIKEKLDEYVIGQEHAKKVISVGVYNHYKRVLSAEQKNGEVEIAKSNMLMIGPTGSGKTYLVQTLAKLLDVPLAITDATSLTEAGYIGDDIESVVSKLLAAADNDVERAEHGIIFIDEIDKIAKKKNTNQRDVSGEAVQQGMLKLLEGSDVEVPVGANSKNAMVPLATVNTSNILFICGGAFDGLEKIIETRLDQKSIGFNAEVHAKDEYNVGEVLKHVLPQDFVKFGLIPEFIGRVPVTVTLDMLDKDAMIRILCEPKNALVKQYKKLFELDGVSLEFDRDALEAIVDKALERKTGARGLRAIMEAVTLDLMYHIPSDESITKCEITKEDVEKNLAIEEKEEKALVEKLEQAS